MDNEERGCITEYLLSACCKVEVLELLENISVLFHVPDRQISMTVICTYHHKNKKVYFFFFTKCNEIYGANKIGE